MTSKTYIYALPNSADLKVKAKVGKERFRKQG